jgi:hypothetical protein
MSVQSPVSSKGLKAMATRRRNPSGNTPSQVLRWPTERARKWTRDFLKLAAADDSVLAVIAIGSAVRPNVVSADLDLVVICNQTKPLHLSSPMEIDLRIYSAGSIDAQIAGGHDLLGWAIKFGKALYQRNYSWDRIVDGWKDRLPLPSAALARERAARAHRRLVKVLGSGDADAGHEQALAYLTHFARTELLDRGVYPASRPELASQLRAVHCGELAAELESFLRIDHIDTARIDQVLNLTA